MSELIRELRAQALVNDARFARVYALSRAAKGYGPDAIRQALRVRGVNDGVIASCIDDNSGEWEARVRAVRDKRFGPNNPSDAGERARQARFLVRRGFTNEQVRRVLSGSRERTVSAEGPFEERAPVASKQRSPMS